MVGVGITCFHLPNAAALPLLPQAQRMLWGWFSGLLTEVPLECSLATSYGI